MGFQRVDDSGGADLELRFACATAGRSFLLRGRQEDRVLGEQHVEVRLCHADDEFGSHQAASAWAIFSA
jgi:hypothetical protein